MAEASPVPATATSQTTTSDASVAALWDLPSANLTSPVTSTISPGAFGGEAANGRKIKTASMDAAKSLLAIIKRGIPLLIQFAPRYTTIPEFRWYESGDTLRRTANRCAAGKYS